MARFGTWIIVCAKCGHVSAPARFAQLNIAEWELLMTEIQSVPAETAYRYSNGHP